MKCLQIKLYLLSYRKKNTGGTWHNINNSDQNQHFK